MVHFSLVYAIPCAPNQNGTRDLELMALLMALTANYVNRYAHQMGQSLFYAGTSEEVRLRVQTYASCFITSSCFISCAILFHLPFFVWHDVWFHYRAALGPGVFSIVHTLGVYLYEYRLLQCCNMVDFTNRIALGPDVVYGTLVLLDVFIYEYRSAAEAAADALLCVAILLLLPMLSCVLLYSCCC